MKFRMRVSISAIKWTTQEIHRQKTKSATFVIFFLISLSYLFWMRAPGRRSTTVLRRSLTLMGKIVPSFD